MVTKTTLATSYIERAPGNFAHEAIVAGAVNALTTIASITINALDPAYGIVNDGTTNNTTAINNLIAGLPSISNAFGGCTYELYFPAGRYMSAGGHVIPSTKRCKISGAGEYVTIFNRTAGSTGDFFTFNAQNSGVENLTIDGNVLSAAGGGDGLVFNSPYGYARNSTITNNGGTGIAIGKTSTAILTRLEGLILRLNRGYGAYVYSGTSDTQWNNVDIGMSGLSGARLSGTVNMLNNVHVWGNGLEASAAGDKCGFWLNSPSNMLSNCQSETNFLHGVLISSTGADGQGLSNCNIWGNVSNGINSFGGTKWHTIGGGSRIHDNGVTNSGGATTSGFANMYNDAGNQWAVSGCTFYDSGLAIPAGSYTGYTPTNPYPGRAAIITTSKHYFETGTTPDYCSFTGNVWRTATAKAANTFVGTNHQQAGNVV